MKEYRKKLKITGGFRDNSRYFYVVKYKEADFYLPKLPFLKDKPAPTEIDCVITEDADGKNTSVNWDLATIIGEVYKVGDTHEVTVRERRSGTLVSVDDNGIKLRLRMGDDKTVFKSGDRVRARVVSVSDKSVELTILKGKPKPRMPHRTIAEVATASRLDAELTDALTDWINEDPGFEHVKNLYEAEDGSWALEAVLHFDAALMTVGPGRTPDQRRVEVFRALCMYVIEGSDMLKGLPAPERAEWIARVSTVATHAEDYGKAYAIHSAGQMREYVEEQLGLLRESDYLFEPERRMRVIMTLLNLDDSLMSEMMDRIFDIIINGDKEHWKAEPFRTAFVNLLELFIAEHREKAIRSTSIDLIHKTIKAIAIQQLLSTAEDAIDRRLNASTYYRLLAYINRDFSREILDDAFAALFTPYREVREYGWDDVRLLDSLYYKTAYRPRDDESGRRLAQRHIHRGEAVEVAVENGMVSLRSVDGLQKPLDLKGLLDWKGLRLYGHAAKLSTKIKKDSTFADVADYWDEAVESLWEAPKTRSAVTDLGPSVGDRVLVRMLDEDKDLTSLFCEFTTQDGSFRGEGWMRMEEIAMYLSSGFSNLDLFRDKAGKPLVLPAEVIHEADSYGEYELSMLAPVEEHVAEKHPIGSKVNCTLRTPYVDPEYGQTFGGVTSTGASCLLQRDDTTGSLAKQSYVAATVVGYNSRGQIICRYLPDEPASHFPVRQALNRLALDMAVTPPASDDDPVAEATAAADEDSVAEQELEPAMMKEIVGILDRTAVIADSRAEAYGYLSVAQAISRAMGDAAAAEYYRKRKRLLKEFENYERNGFVDSESLDRLIAAIGQDLIDTDYLVNDSITKFRILDSLKHRDNTPALYAIRESASNPSVRNAADLALALLLTRRFELPNMERQLEARINTELGVEVKTSQMYDFGEETQEVEFKSSIVYHANSRMQPWPELQGHVIMETICGFLNSDRGGTLYLGVRDSGVANGVDQDMRYLQVDRDGFTRYVGGMIRRELGQIAGQCVTWEWKPTDGYQVFVVKVEPAPELVHFRGRYWIRQGTEKLRLSPENIEGYARIHRTAYERYQKRKK